MTIKALKKVKCKNMIHIKHKITKYLLFIAASNYLLIITHVNRIIYMKF